MLKKFFPIFLCLVFLCCGCVQKTKNEPVDTLTKIRNEGVLVVGVKTDTPPFGFLDKNGKNIGIDVDLARFTAKRILGDENKVKFVPVNPSNRIMKLSSKEVDMVIATMSLTPKRQLILDFSIPYHTAGQAMMVRSGSKIRSLKQLNGKKVAIVFGSTVENSLRSAVPNATILGYKTYPSAVSAVKSGVADAMIADDTILLGFTMKDKSLKILNKRYSKEPYGIAFRKESESEQLIDVVDMELREIINNGELKRMKRKWGI